jgi:flavin reductase (DIM6/NTAB) family NADH-FMN oxidoreductase RutF
MDAKSQKDLHFYEPKNGHGLRHDPFNAIVAPRPIGWISSRDGKGNINLAPTVFSTAFATTRRSSAFPPPPGRTASRT